MPILDALALPWVKLAIQFVLVAWMVVVSVLDHRSGRIPNAVTAPVFLGVGAFRLIEGLLGEPSRFLLLLVWALIFVLWLLNFLGGGDAKFLLALYALFPSMEFTAALALILLVIMVPLLLWQWRGRSVRQLGGGLRDRLLTGQFLPTAEELQTQGRRYAWTFAIPAIVYTLVWW